MTAPTAPTHLRRRPSRRPLTLLVAGLVTVLGLGHSTTPTDAQWTDQAYAEGAVATGWWAESLARAQLIEVDGLGLDVLDVTTTDAEYPADPGPTTSAIDVAALESLVGLEIPALQLPLVGDGSNGGLLDLGDAAGAGLLNGYASATDHSLATAASGTVTDDGALNLSPVEDPSDTDLTRLDLTALLDDHRVSGLTDAVVDEVSLGLGALASTASWEAGGTPSSDYVLAGAELQISSPAVGQLVTGLTGAVSTLNDRLNSLLGPEGPLQVALDGLGEVLDLRIPLLLTLDVDRLNVHARVELASLTDELLREPRTSEDGLITLDVSSGTIAVDLSRLSDGGDLNEMPPSSELLTAENTTRIVTSVTDLLATLITGVEDAVTQAVTGTGILVTADAELSLLGILLPPTAEVSITIDTTVRDILDRDGARPGISIEGDLLGIPLVTLVGRLLEPVVETVLPALLSPLTSVLEEVPGLVEEVVAPVVRGVSGTLSPVLAPLLSQLLQLTVNEQELTGPEGEETFTARALTVELLPVLGDASVTVGLASSSVRVWRPSGATE